MSHSPIIIDDIERLQQEAGLGQLHNDLSEFNQHYVDLDTLIRSPIPPFHEMTIHGLLEDIDKWLKKASVADEDFQTKFSYYTDQINYWLGIYG